VASGPGARLRIFPLIDPLRGRSTLPGPRFSPGSAGWYARVFSSGAKCTKNQRFEIAQLHCARELPSFDLLAKFGWTANPVKAGLWPPPPAADGLDRVCRPAVVCHHEIDGKVWPRGNLKPLVFGYFQAAVDTRGEFFFVVIGPSCPSLRVSVLCRVGSNVATQSSSDSLSNVPTYFGSSNFRNARELLSTRPLT
jgi:hypothetical protein